MREGLLGRLLISAALFGIMAWTTVARAQAAGPSPWEEQRSGPPTPGARGRVGVRIPVDSRDREPPAATYPATSSHRPLTLPRGHIYGAFAVDALMIGIEEDPIAGGGAGRAIDAYVLLGAAAAYGITDVLEIGLGPSGVLPLFPPALMAATLDGLGGLLSPQSNRGFVRPEVRLRGRLLARSGVQLGLEGSAELPIANRGTSLSIGLPLRIRIGDYSAFDASLSGLYHFRRIGERAGQSLGFAAQAGIRWATDRVYAAFTLAVVSYPQEEDGTYIPVFGEVGSSLRLPFGALDLYAQAGFPHLYVPGAEPSARQLDVWQVQIGVRVFARVARPRP